MLKNRGRHGDLAINRIEELPIGLKEQKGGVLVEGEATGHHHTLVARSKSEVHVFIDEKGKKYFSVRGGATITHPEHKTIKIGEGYFEIVIEKEYDPFTETLRRVAD